MVRYRSLQGKGKQNLAFTPVLQRRRNGFAHLVSAA
jgi:hypothetical protein